MKARYGTVLLCLLIACVLIAASEAFALTSGRENRVRKGMNSSGHIHELPRGTLIGQGPAFTRLSMSGGAAALSSENDKSLESSKSSMTQSVFNLVKNIMGAGMLSLPAGVAAFSDSRSAIIPSSVIITLLGALSAYTFTLVGRSCAETKAESYEQAWAKAVSPKTSLIPAAACVATCFAGCLAYTLIIGDTFSALAQLMNVPARFSARSSVIGILSVLVLLPLSLLKNLSALGFTSMLGTGGLLYTAGMMGLRYFDGSYAPGGKFFGLLSAASKPAFGTKTSNPLLFLVLVSMLGTAYEAHFNAPLFYKELKNNTLPRYNFMVSTSFAVAITTMIAVTAFGFLTFGGSSAGFILNNYAGADRLATIARSFVGFSIVFSYPLCFVGLRDGVMEIMGITKPSEGQRRLWTVGLLGFVSTIALFLKDLGFVNSFGGAVVASGIIYIFPAMMFLTPLRKKVKSGLLKLAGRRRFEALANYSVIGIGALLGVLGAVISVLESFFPHILSP